MIYILHFDINKTIIMHDPVSKVSMHGMLNSIISECIWGSITIPDNNNNESLTILPVDSWKLYSTIPSRIPPSDNLLTYGEFLETRTLLERHEKKALKTTFTEPGKVGEECRQYYEKCLNHLCPSNTSPCYHILPSFFKLLKTLRERQLDYRIIFRTFGTDTNAVVEEYNSFCRGDHPLFPHSMDMSQHILPPNSIARIRRSHDEVTLQFHNSNQNSVNTHPSIHGVKNIYHFLYHQMTTSTHAFSIQDDFSYWDLCSERDDSGKLLLIDRNHEGKDIIQIFFDDNIERDRAHIVDVRDISSNSNSNSSNELSDDKQGSYTGLPIPFTESNNKYLCRVSPFDAITDEDYYVKEFDLISNSRESEHTHHNHHNNKL